MRGCPRAHRCGLGIALLASIGAGVLAGSSLSASAQQADGFAFNASVAPTSGTMAPLVGTFQYGLSGVCAAVTVPSPASATVSGYVDVPGDDSGACGAVTGGGTATLAYCSTGSISADWNLSEPGDTAHLVADGIIVGGVAVMVAQPAAMPGEGYWDPSTSGSPGSAVSVALFAPSDPTQRCPNPKSFGTVLGAVVGAS